MFSLALGPTYPLFCGEHKYLDVGNTRSTKLRVKMGKTKIPDGPETCQKLLFILH